MDVLTKKFEIALVRRLSDALWGIPREKTFADTKSSSGKRFTISVSTQTLFRLFQVAFLHRDFGVHIEIDWVRYRHGFTT
jgi:hypothetical protein